MDTDALGSGLAKTLNAKYDDWLDVMVVNTAGGQYDFPAMFSCAGTDIDHPVGVRDGVFVMLDDANGL